MRNSDYNFQGFLSTPFGFLSFGVKLENLKNPFAMHGHPRFSLFVTALSF
jgi:hypothetical protein